MSEREKILAQLRELARTASNEQARGAYLHAAEVIEGGGGVEIAHPARLVAAQRVSGLAWPLTPER